MEISTETSREGGISKFFISTLHNMTYYFLRFELHELVTYGTKQNVI
jgi:hypothetical protein